MSISSRQRDLALARALEELMKDGTPPDRAQVATRMDELMPAIIGSPTFQLREQSRKSTYNIDWQNEMFAEAAEDLAILYEENISIVERILMHLGLAEVNGRRFGQELRALQASMDQLLLTSSRGTNFFQSAYDRFVDMNKIDQARSDVGLDVATGMITLAPEASTRRIPMPHLLQLQQAPIVLIQPNRGIVRPVPGAPFGNAFQDMLSAWQVQVLTEKNAPTEVSVVVDVVPPLPDGQGQPRPPVEITQIQLHSLSATPYTVLPLWSRDGVAFSLFDGLNTPILADEESVIINVAPTEVTSLQLRIRKEGPDSEEEVPVTFFDSVLVPEANDFANQFVTRNVDLALTPVGGIDALNDSSRQRIDEQVPNGDPRASAGVKRLFSTVFGFRQISAWRMGYRRHGTLVSQALTPEGGAEQSISKVSLSVDEEIPQNASIRYEIAANTTPEVFLPISPIGRNDQGAPQVVDFTKVQRAAREDNVFTIDATNPATSLGTIRGTEYFAVRTITDASIFQSAHLYRGRNAWHCERSSVTQTKTVRNLFVDFTDRSTTPLYLFEEEERIPSHPTNDGTQEVEVRTRFRILLGGDTFNEAEDLESPNDTVAKFAVRRLLRRPADGTFSDAQLTSSTVSVIAVGEIASVGAAAQPAGATAGRQGAVVNITGFSSAGLLADNTAGNKADLVGQPFQLSYTNNSRSVAGVFDILSAQIDSAGTLILSLDDPGEVLESTTSAVSPSWEVLAVNITSSITDINGNTLKLDQEQKLGADDLLEITYRRRLLPSESPLTSTFVLKPSATSTKVYDEGTDYTFDQVTRTLARLSSGSIPTSADGTITARADFEYEEKNQGLVIYRTFLFNPSPTPAMTLSEVSVDRSNGEEILLQTDSGFLDLNGRAQVPALAPGWHQLVVRSNPIFRPNGEVDTTSAIYKATTLKETRGGADTGRFLLPAHEHPDTAATTVENKFAGYFTRQSAILEPMTQVSFRNLSTNIRKTDRTVFAVKRAAEAPATATDVVALNFDPQQSTDILYLPPDFGATGARPLLREDFGLEYAFVPASVESLTGVKLRATLERTADSDGSVTPILRGYTLRFSI